MGFGTPNLICHNTSFTGQFKAGGCERNDKLLYYLDNNEVRRPRSTTITMVVTIVERNEVYSLILTVDNIYLSIPDSVSRIDFT